MIKPTDIASMSSEEMGNLILQLLVQITEMQATIDELRAENDRLRRGGHRSAAPFSKNTPKKNPKPPGRKPGEGNFTNRTAPSTEKYSQPIIDVPVTHTACPHCRGPLAEAGSETVTNTDLPITVNPEILAYRIAMCRCSDCGLSVRGEHPSVAPDQTGATAHRLGNRLLATAQWLHYGIGVSMRKIPRIMQDLFGIRLTQSALTQHALRQLHGRLAVAYEAIRGTVSTSERVNTDDTGWRIGGVGAQLMGFDCDTEAYYQIRRRHRNEEVREVIGSDYAGVMGCDRGKSYDAVELAGVRQQKCMSHIQRSLSEVLEQKQRGGCWFARRLKDLLRAAVGLWHEQRGKKRRPPGWSKRASALHAKVTHHLRNRAMRDKDNQRLLNELGWHHDRGNLLRFLEEPGIEPTNNRAERMLRPAVIARKISQCSKNDAGAQAHAMFMSVIETLRRRCPERVLDALVAILAGGSLPEPSLPAVA